MFFIHGQVNCSQECLLSVSADTSPSKPIFKKRERLHAALIVAGLVVLVYGRSLIGDLLVGGADVIRSAYPIRDHFWSIIQRGDLPTWSPTLMGGYPIIVEEQASLFYPPEWIFGAFQSPVAYNLIIGFHTWLAGFGSYLLARKLHMSRLAAWIIVVAAMFGAPLTARVAAGHPSHLYGRSLMIWALVAILYLAEKPNWWSSLGLATVFGAQLLIGIGNYQTALYTALVSILFGTFVLFNKVAIAQRARFITWGLIALLVAVGLGASRAVVTLDVGLQSSRQSGLSVDSLNYGSLPPIMLSGYFLPYTFDDPSITDYTWPEFALYVGSAPFVLCLYAIRRRGREKVVLIWILIAIIFLLLSLGEQGQLFSLFVKFIPGYQLFRNPARHGMVISLAVIMLAGYGFDAFVSSLKRRVEVPRLIQQRIWVAGIVVGLLVLSIAATNQEPSSGSSLEVLPYRLARGAIWFVSAVIVFYLANKIFAIRPTLTVGMLIVGVVAFDVVLYAYPQIYQNSKPADLPYISPDNFTESEFYSVAFFEEGDSSDWGRVNVAAENGVRLLNMYTGITPARMSKVINILAGRPPSAPLESNLIQLSAISRPDLLDYLGVKYLLVNPSSEFGHDPSLREGRIFEQIQSFENTDAMPFAFVVSDIQSVSSPAAALEFVEKSEDLRREAARVEGIIEDSEMGCPESTVGGDLISDLRLEGGNLRFNYKTSQAGMLIINQTYQNGWKGWVDGEASKVYPVNYRWMGIYLPCSGQYQIHLRYLPASLTTGLVISASTFLLITFISLGLIFRSRREQQS